MYIILINIYIYSIFIELKFKEYFLICSLSFQNISNLETTVTGPHNENANSLFIRIN